MNSEFMCQKRSSLQWQLKKCVNVVPSNWVSFLNYMLDVVDKKHDLGQD